MERPLSEYTLEELWQLFPIELKEYTSSYKHQYEKVSQELSCLLGEYIFRVNHIGSTFVQGLLAKPIVDILLEILPHTNVTKVIDLLLKNGWTLMSKKIEPNEVRISFNKGYTPKGFDSEVFHLHIRYKGDWDELYFRDYLLDYPDVAKKYVDLKKTLLEKYKYDRDAYTKAKTDFINTYTKLARIRYENKYAFR